MEEPGNCFFDPCVCNMQLSRFERQTFIKAVDDAIESPPQ